MPLTAAVSPGHSRPNTEGDTRRDGDTLGVGRGYKHVLLLGISYCAYRSDRVSKVRIGSENKTGRLAVMDGQKETYLCNTS